MISPTWLLEAAVIVSSHPWNQLTGPRSSGGSRYRCQLHPRHSGSFNHIWRGTSRKKVIEINTKYLRTVPLGWWEVHYCNADANYAYTQTSIKEQSKVNSTNYLHTTEQVAQLKINLVVMLHIDDILVPCTNKSHKNQLEKRTVNIITGLQRQGLCRRKILFLYTTKTIGYPAREETRIAKRRWLS